jgi:hypothetical protein
VDVEADLDLVADRLAHGLELGNRGIDGNSRLQQVAVVREAPAHELPALFFRLKAGLDERSDLHPMPGIVGVADDLIADPPPE